MIHAKISEVKDSLSAYLRRVKAGEPVVVLERSTPIARIVPVDWESENAESTGVTGGNPKLARLERAGIVMRRGVGSPLDAIGQPLRPRSSVLEALLEERAEEWRDGRG